MDWLDAQSIIDAFGDWAVLAVVFVLFMETAFIFTSFLPGDSLLFIIGLTLSVGSGVIPDWLGFVLIWLAAFSGTQLGWYVGYKIGPPLFERRENFIFNKKVVETTRKFFDKYGVRAIILARFVPIIRALVPMFAGISKVNFKRFTQLNAIGATLWLVVFMVPGYFLGNLPLVKQNLETAVLIVIIVSSLPLPIELLRSFIQNRRAKRKQQRLDAEYEVSEGYTDLSKLPKNKD